MAFLLGFLHGAVVSGFQGDKPWHTRVYQVCPASVTLADVLLAKASPMAEAGVSMGEADPRRIPKQAWFLGSYHHSNLLLGVAQGDRVHRTAL